MTELFGRSPSWRRVHRGEAVLARRWRSRTPYPRSRGAAEPLERALAQLRGELD